jgi:HSP20 family molecular chaperone IbpA
MWSVLVLGCALSGVVGEHADEPMRPVGVTSTSQSTVPAWVVGETAHSVRVVIHFPPGTDPASFEVQLLGAEVIVVARDAEGSHIRSEVLHLKEAPVEDGATADYQGDGWLTVTLRKRAAEPSAD